MLRLIDHRILAARRNGYVLYAIAIEIAKCRLELRHQRELVAKLPLDKLVVDFARRRRRLRQRGQQHGKAERQEEGCFSHAFTVVPKGDYRQVTKVTWKAGFKVS